MSDQAQIKQAQIKQAQIKQILQMDDAQRATYFLKEVVTNKQLWIARLCHA